MTLDTESLQRIDSYPYRHRIAELMSAPVHTAASTMTIAEASGRMIDHQIGSLLVVDAAGRPVGIITERDVVRAMATLGGQSATLPIGSIMSAPVATIPQDAFAFVAFGRMPRLGVRHLLVVDDQQRAVGMVSARVLMRLRAAGALVIGDDIASAADGRALADIWRRIPTLVKGLITEGVHPLDVTSVISALLCDITARAADLASVTMEADGWGPAPAPWCVMVLGSGGRGESAMKADQDNAIVHAGNASDDVWYAEAGRRLSTCLAEAGIPLCSGGVMAVNAGWRRNVEDWFNTIDHWIRNADGSNLLNLDIFIDLLPVYGDGELARQLREHLLDVACRHAPFLHAVAMSLMGIPVPLSLFGELVTVDGRLSIKKSGLLPLISTVRLLAVKHRIAATSTRARVQALADGGFLPATDARNLMETHATLADMLLRQQLRDFERGLPLTNDIDPKELGRTERKRLRDGLRHIRNLKLIVETAVSSV
jgi:signal-transduction protein with cAMP-binding, CBS, and nucleotidyltransferase domain